MTRLDRDLERLSQRGTPADPDEVIGRALTSAVSSKQAGSGRSSSALVGLAAACVIAVGLGAFAFVAASRRDVENAPVSATTPSTAAEPESTVGSAPAPVSTTEMPSSLAAAGLAELATVDDDHLVVASSLPEGWTVSPVLVGEGSQRWEFSDSTGSVAGQVLSNVGDGGASGGQTTATEVSWELEPTEGSGVIATAQAGDLAQVTVFASGVGDGVDSIEEFLTGLGIGGADDHPAGAFNTSTDGAVVATVDDDLAVRAAPVGDYLCWSMASSSSSSDGCVQDPLGPAGNDWPATSEGIAVLDFGGTGIPANYVDADAPIVTSIVYLTGVTVLDVPSVSVGLSTGETVVVPVGDLDKALGLRFFAFRTTVDGDVFNGDEFIKSITATDPTTEVDAPASGPPTRDDSESVVPDGFVPAAAGPDDPRDPIQRFLGVPAGVEESGEWADRVLGRAVVECMAAQGFDLDESTWQTLVFDPSSDDDQKLFDALRGDGGCEEVANRQTNLLPDAEAEFAVLETTMRSDQRAIDAQDALQGCLEQNGATGAVATPDECTEAAQQSNEVLSQLFEEYGPSWIVEHRNILEPLRDRLAGLLERSGSPT